MGYLALNCLLVTYRALLMCGLDCHIGKISESLEVIGREQGITTCTSQANILKIVDQFGFKYEDESSSDYAMVNFLDEV